MTSRARPRPTRPRPRPTRARPIQKTECQKNPNGLGCLEEQLSNVRSGGSVAGRRSSNVPYDPQIAFPLPSGGMGVLNIIGGQTQALEKAIEKKSWRRI